MVVGFLTICVISAYHHQCCKLEPCAGEVYSIQHYMIKFVLPVTCDWSVVSSTNKTTGTRSYIFTSPGMY